jgi:hypothetical protein
MWQCTVPRRRTQPTRRLSDARLGVQLVLQFARLSKVSVTADPATYRTLPFYRSFGFHPFALIERGQETMAFIDPQHAFNTITGLLNTRTGAARPAHVAILRNLPQSVQPIYSLYHQEWDHDSNGVPHRCKHLQVHLKLCNYPSKDDATARYHPALVEYGHISVRIDEGVVTQGTVELSSHLDRAHALLIEAALKELGRDMGDDLRAHVWRQG